MRRDLSICIPARREMFLKKTVEDILKNKRGNTEIIIGLDGEWSNPPIDDHPDVHIVCHSTSIGQRAIVNECVRISNAKYICKVDAHCAFDEGFDIKLMKDMQEDLTMVPVMRNLHVFDWVCKKCGDRRYQGPTPVSCPKCDNKDDFERDVKWIAKTNPQSTSYCFDPEPHFQYFREFKNRGEAQGNLTETMSLQGSCFMVTRNKFWELSLCDETFGSWGSQGIEVAVKTWLSGGKVVCNHNTWYAHLFRTQGGDFGFPYDISGRQVDRAKKHARDLFFNNKWPYQRYPLSWLIDKFWPIPRWSDDDRMAVREAGRTFGQRDIDRPTPTTKDAPTKGLCFYTDNKVEPFILSAVQKVLKSSCDGHRLVSVSLEPMDFGENVVLKLQRGYLAMAKQQLAGLEALDTDIVFMCFQGNTYIETISGLKRIDKVCVGELVKTHLNRFRKVTNVFKRKYKQRMPIIEIKTSHSNIRCTPEHPFYVYRNKEKLWLFANSLVEGDLLLYPQNQYEDYINLDVNIGRKIRLRKHIDKVLVDEDFARFMGLYLAEGHYNGKNGIGFTFNNNEKEIHEFIKRVCFDKFNYHAKQRSHWSTQILINIHDLGPKFKEWFGANAREKCIPEFVFKWNLKNKLSFILGLLQGDASWHKRGSFYVGLMSASQILIKDAIRLMNESGVGWDNNIKTRKNNSGFAKHSKKELWTYQINLSKKAYEKMMDILSSIKVSSDYIGIPITKIRNTQMSLMPKYKNNKKTGYENYVYNLEVEQDNSYIAQSAIVHNCEHDILYPKCHFDFVPPRKDTFYYNLNWWKVRMEDGQALHFKAKQVSGLCAYRDILIEYFRNRVKAIESGEIGGRRHFEPGGRHRDAYNKLTDKGFDTWWSEVPYVDIRHGTAVTRNIFDPSGYRGRVVDWTMADSIPSWGITKGRFRDFLKEAVSAVQTL